MLPETLVGKGLPNAVGDSTFGGVGVGVTGGPGLEGGGLSGSQVGKVLDACCDGVAYLNAEDRGSGEKSVGLSVARRPFCFSSGGQESPWRNETESKSKPADGRGPAAESAAAVLESASGRCSHFDGAEETVCAWCERDAGRELKAGVSHGICGRHAAAEYARYMEQVRRERGMR